ncbi:MAG: diacylglycerol kinase [Clostridiales bacterium]|nr:diacylglycerol kinase [Clostridiales bacterium]HBM81250.1 diacylglycerol kinase [Clostridiaceae bacterium]
MKAKRITDSFNYAIQGIIYTLRTQRNMRIHFAIAAAVLCISLFFDLSKMELLILFISITFVIVMELINTAIEATIDIFVNYYHPLAKIAKNVAAGAVLVSALNAILVGYLLFFDRLMPVTQIVIYKVKNSPPHTIFICLAIVMIAVISLKAYFGEGTPLRGGMPSGHSAIAFSIATMISLLTKDLLIATLAFFMAFLVAQTRIESKIHSVLQTVIGGILGITVTILIFVVF